MRTAIIATAAALGLAACAQSPSSIPPVSMAEPDHGDASTALGIVLIGLYGFACFCIGVAVALLRLL